jgi:hypothetical protein
LILQIRPQASSCSYQKDFFKSGEPYLKINTGDSLQWLGITSTKFAEILKVYIDKTYLDSQVILLTTRAKVCDENDSSYKQIMKILNDNEILYVNLVNDYKNYSTNLYDKLVSAERKKYWFGIGGFSIGFAASISIVLLMNSLHF